MISLMISTLQDKYILTCRRNERRSTRSENRFHGIAPSFNSFNQLAKADSTGQRYKSGARRFVKASVVHL